MSSRWPMYSLLAFGLVVRGGWADEPLHTNIAKAGSCCKIKQDLQHVGKRCLDELMQRLLSFSRMCNAAAPKQYEIEAKLICHEGEKKEVISCPTFVMSPGRPVFAVLNGKPVGDFRSCGIQLEMKHADQNFVQVEIEISSVGLEAVDIGNGAQAIPFRVLKTQSKLPLGTPINVPLQGIPGSDAAWLELEINEIVEP